ncbi:hypothetical protein R3I94_000258 [Phoxinus phoxinus]
MTTKSKWNKRTQCSAINCKNYQCNSTNLAFHRFPKDPERCARWVQHLRNASLMGISSQRLNLNYRVCSAHFHATQFKRPSNVHAGLKWDAVPTMIDAPNPPPPLDLEFRRKPPKPRQELPPKKRKKINVVYLSNAGSSAADSVQQPTGSETDINLLDASEAGPSMPLTPLFPTMALPIGLEAAAKEHALKMKIRSLKVQVCKLKAKMREVNRLKKTRKAGVNKESVMKQMKKLLPAKAYAFVSTQIHMSQRKAHGFRWTTQDKAFFLSLLHANPKCYRLLFKVFSMPSVRTLQKLMKSIDFKPGFNHTILATMKKAMETTKPMDKVCAIITDEMSLKQAVHYNESADRIESFEDFGRGLRTPYVANYASAFMVRGLFRKWKQLFGYCFTSGPIPHTRLQSLLLEAICELRKAGMECLVFICDQGSGNRSMLARLGVTKEKPYFEVDAVRVFCLWDPPHLIKNIRNNWRSSGFTLDGDHIFWGILEDLYTYDSKQDIRLCCRLTKKHVHLLPFASMRVRFATQVLSHSVAVGIKTLAQVKQLTGQAQRNYMAAAKFCENFDGIFNCFNSKQLKDSHKLKSALSDASAHFPFLEKCMEWLPRLKLARARPGTKQIPCVEGWQHNIVCLKMIWCDLRERHQVSHLLTNRLNQDCLENAYSAIRARGGNRDSPDSVQFECGYRAVATGLMFNNSEKTNCEQDLDTFLLQFSTYASQESPQVVIDTEPISAEHYYISQEGPRIIVPVNTEKIMNEHGYARMITDCKVDDPPVTANAGVKADQVEQPMDYSLDNQFDSHQISFSSGDHGK